MFYLTGKNVWIAGGCGLIGSAITQVFRILDANVTTIDKKGSDVQMDISDFSSVKLLFENNSPEVWINATYPSLFPSIVDPFFWSSCECAQRMAQNGGGVIINLASIYGVVGPKPSMYDGTSIGMTPSSYSFAKGGIIALSRALACEYGKYDVRVNCISPGGVADSKNTQDRLFYKRYCSRVPLGRMAEPEDVANACAFLASDQASYITGVNLMVDGGFTAL